MTLSDLLSSNLLWFFVIAYILMWMVESVFKKIWDWVYDKITKKGDENGTERNKKGKDA